MFCKYCGMEIPEGAAFCPKCGKPVAGTDSPAGHTDQPTNNSTGNTYGGEAAQPQGGAVSRVNAVTDIGKSTLMLVFTIFLSVEILFNLLGSLSVLNLLAILIEVILCVGCWMVYASSLQGKAPATGFSVLRIGVLLQLVIMVIGAIVTIVSAIRWSYGAAMILGYLIEIVLVCWCFYGLYRVTNDGRKIANGESATWNVTTPCFVIFIILAIFEVVGTLLFSFNVATIVAVVVWILAAAILYTIRKQN